MTLFIFSSFQKIPVWLPIVAYLVVVFFRVKGKIGNNIDWLKINKRDEKLELEKVAEDMAQKGLTFSSHRNDAEEKVRVNFEYERKKQKRKFENELINSLFLH